MTGVIVQEGDGFEGETLQDAALAQEGIVALGIQRSEAHISALLAPRIEFMREAC